MTEQEKREKVIKGLECCVDEIGISHAGCPYYTDGNKNCEGSEPFPTPLLRDALELLKAQEPRVLTLDEYKAMAEKPRNEKPPVWEELRDSDSSEWGWALPQQAYDGYGIVWRAWTYKPTEEQREAVKWGG